MWGIWDWAKGTNWNPLLQDMKGDPNNKYIEDKETPVSYGWRKEKLYNEPSGVALELEA